MNKEIADQWVAALRSGEYEQSQRGYLRDGENRYCCLGVLCDLAARAGVISESTQEDGFHLYGKIGELSLPPREVMDWAGLWSDTGTPRRGVLVFPETTWPTLTFANDNGETFATIADVIEREWENL